MMVNCRVRCIAALACLLLAATVYGAVSVTQVKTFSHAIKGHSLCPCMYCPEDSGPCMNCTNGWTGNDCQRTAPDLPYQAIMYNYTIPEGSPSSEDAPGGMIRLLWFTGELSWTTGFGNTTIRIYIDGEEDASIAFRIYEAHSLGFGWKQGEHDTWGTRQFGKGSLFGGTYLAFKIPFDKNFLVTAQLPDEDIFVSPTSHSLYFICHGVLNTPLQLEGNSEITFPRHTRLHLHQYDNHAALAHSRVPIVNQSGNGGFLYLVNMRAQSWVNHFLEGEFRATIDGGEQMLLSSGTEDYFLSAQYFDAGAFQFPNSGCNHLSLDCLTGLGECRMTAYRFHTADPIIWQSNISFTWQIGDPSWHVDNTSVQFYAWVYEF